MNAIMYGAGNIGRGFIGQRFFLSGFNTTFIDVNPAVVDALNAANKYPIYVTHGTEYVVEWVENVNAVNGRDNDAVIDAIAGADIMATALGVNILPFVAPLIARAIERRMANGAAPMNILICENLIGSNRFLRGEILKHLAPEALDYFEANIGLVCVSVGRTVPPTPAEILAENALAVCAEPYSELPCDLEGFRPVGAPLPEIAGLVAFSPFEYFIQRKLLIHNMGHALMAYYAYQKNYGFIFEAATDGEIKYVLTRALIESARALAKEHGASLDDTMQFVEDLMVRFENKLLVDSLARVGRDPKRKLSAGDRLVGAFKLVRKQGGVPAHIAIGVAAGLLYDEPADEAAVEISSYARAEGVAAALAKYCEITDPADVAMIEKFYVMLRDKAPFAEFVEVLAELKSVAH